MESGNTNWVCHLVRNLIAEEPWRLEFHRTPCYSRRVATFRARNQQHHRFSIIFGNPATNRFSAMTSSPSKSSVAIDFFQFAKGPNGPSPSGYCQKLETFLRAVNFTNYTLKDTVPIFAPKGKLPYVVLHDEEKTITIADSHFIIKHLISSRLVSDPDESLTPAQRADSRAWQTWTEELAYPAIVHTRWSRPANYAIMKNSLPMPWLAKPMVGAYFQRVVTKALYGHGVGRHSEREIDELLKEYVDGLEARLGEDRFFHGENPTMVDIIVYGFLANALGEAANPEYTNMILACERIRNYIAELTRRWFPEYEKISKMVD